ncbi:ankyrin repeat domain-containing protein [Holosporaceae bacterium 'Namur']|nr:ankyrin repeat domain-containing protein [Holosporaceae bacterium 'Namur']
MVTNTTSILLWDSANKLRPLFASNNMEIFEILERNYIENSVTSYVYTSDTHPSTIKTIEAINKIENSVAQENPLYVASNFGNHERVKYLLKQGYSPNFYTQGYKQTPLHTCYDEKVAKMLIEYGADLNAVNQGGETPYEYINFFYCLESRFNCNGDSDDEIARKEAMDAEGIEYIPAECEACAASFCYK